ncbi:MAG: hypothetical protein WCJ64_24445 [Rhodospirillaceae bacterium]
MDGAVIFKRSWKLGNGFGSESVSSNVPVLMPEIVGKEGFTVNEIGSGCAVGQYNGVFSELIQFSVSIESTQPLLIMRAVLDGCDDITFNGVGAAAESANHLGLFVHGNPEDICSSLHPSHNPIRVVHASITVERLRSLCQGMRLPEFLEDASSDHARNGMATKKLSGTQRRLFSEIVSSPYSGQLSNLYREGKMLEIVASVFSDLIGEKESSKEVLAKINSRMCPN